MIRSFMCVLYRKQHEIYSLRPLRFLCVFAVKKKRIERQVAQRLVSTVFFYRIHGIENKAKNRVQQCLLHLIPKHSPTNN